MQVVTGEYVCHNAIYILENNNSEDGVKNRETKDVVRGMGHETAHIILMGNDTLN